MDFGTFILLIVIGFIFYKIFSSSGSKPSSKQQARTRPSRPQSRSSRSGTDQSLIRNAQKQVTRGNFDEASNLYLRAGQVFTAAKMKLFKGPQASEEALQLIRMNAPQRYDVILDNLVNEFYFRLNKPAVSVAILRSAGYNERAEAIEVATGIRPSAPQPSQVEPSRPDPNRKPPVSPDRVITEEPMETKSSATFDVESVEPVTGDDLDRFLDSGLAETEPAKTIVSGVSNTLHLAAADLNQKCIVCRKTIKAGDPFIYCLKCGKPGHYRDFGEMMKVTGKCPSCRERVVIGMYQIE